MDADIAERVMMSMMEQNILVLPIHDSFIVHRWKYAKLKNEMIKAYRERMNADIEVDVEHFYADFLLGNEPMDPEDPLDDLIIEALENRKRTPEYEGYYKRMDDFLRRQTPEFVTDFKGETVG